MRGTPRCRRRCSGPSSCLYTHDTPDCHPSAASISLPFNQHPLSLAAPNENCQRWTDVRTQNILAVHFSLAERGHGVQVRAAHVVLQPHRALFRKPVESQPHPGPNQQIQTSSDGVSNKWPNQEASGVDSRHPDCCTLLRTAAWRATVALFAVPSAADAIDVVCSSECLAGQLTHDHQPEEVKRQCSPDTDRSIPSQPVAPRIGGKTAGDVRS